MRAEQTTLPNLNVSDLEWMKKMILVLKEFRKHNQDVTANQMLTFLYIASGQKTTQAELAGELGFSDGTMSRICAVLSDRGNRGVAGQNLIEMVPSQTNYRSLDLRPTAKGRSVLDTLRRILAEKK